MTLKGDGGSTSNINTKRSENVQDGAWLVRLFIHVKRNVSACDLRRRGYNIKKNRWNRALII